MGLPAPYILTARQMAECDRQMIATGIDSRELMRRAGESVARVIAAHYAVQPVLVLCGSGHNGGDGFIAASKLHEMGWPVQVAVFGSAAVLKPDTKWASSLWAKAIEKFDPKLFLHRPLVVDAIFGTGLTREIQDGDILSALDYINKNNLACVAVDIPSGVDADSGNVGGITPVCELTVTFFQKKRGHVLMNGKSLCGKIVVADIGIPFEAAHNLSDLVIDNAPGHWIDYLSLPMPHQHKYSRGGLLIKGGDKMTGAARLVARAARSVVIGVVWIAAKAESKNVYALDDAANIIRSVRGWKKDVLDPKISAIVIGPGAGISWQNKKNILQSLKSGKPVVLDADALRCFEKNPQELFANIHGCCIMTPHAGEFAALFGSSQQDKITATRDAAERSGAIIVYKGNDTVISHPDGRVCVQSNTSSKLATAGSGDVLAGVIGGLLATGMSDFYAACAGVYMHSMAAIHNYGPISVAELPHAIEMEYERLSRSKFPF